MAVASPVGWAQDAPAKTADEIAKELANPNTPLATLTFKNQFRWFEGDLGDADGWSSYTLFLQPSLPFTRSNGDLIFFRPAIPFEISGRPVYDRDGRDFDGEVGIGDISFDLAYGRTSKTGFMWAAGMVSTLPSATNNKLSGGQLTLGPELLLAKMGKKTVLGAFPNHQWDVTGWKDNDISRTTSQFFGIYLPKGGWSVGSSPIISYDWISEQWTVPLNLTIGKTIIRNGRPWKLGMELNYYIENSDAFGEEWNISFNVAPVVKNMFAEWFK
jgi:hypothetical protein